MPQRGGNVALVGTTGIKVEWSATADQKVDFVQLSGCIVTAHGPPESLFLLVSFYCPVVHPCFNGSAADSAEGLGESVRWD